MKLTKLINESCCSECCPVANALEQSEISKKAMNQELDKSRELFKDVKTSDIDSTIEAHKKSLKMLGAEEIETNLKEHNVNYRSYSRGFKIFAKNRDEFKVIRECLGDTKFKLLRSTDENYRYEIDVDKRGLKGMRELTEKIESSTYDIVDEMNDRFTEGGKHYYSQDEVEEYFALACRDVLDIDNIWDEQSKADELFKDVRGVLEYSGWSTIQEGDFEGGVTDNDPEAYKNGEYPISVDERDTTLKVINLLIEGNYLDKKYTVEELMFLLRNIPDDLCESIGMNINKVKREDGIEHYANVKKHFAGVGSEEDTKKTEVNEDLKIITDISSFKPWSGATALYNEIVDKGLLDTLEFVLEDIYPDGLTATDLNDLLWFEGDWIRQELGMTDDVEESMISKVRHCVESNPVEDAVKNEKISVDDEDLDCAVKCDEDDTECSIRC